MEMTHRYRLLYRPPSFATLPRGLQWDFAELPTDNHYLATKRPDVPVSEHRFGVIKTDRELTPEELAAFELEPVN